MNTFLNLLSKILKYDFSEIVNNVIYIHCSIILDDDYHVHSYYHRHIKDLNIGDNQTILVIKCPKYYVDRSKNNKTFTFPLEFAETKIRRTKRLTKYIERHITEMSAIGLERTMRSGVAKISDSTILRIVKKNSS